jgi:hypothetical protein
VEQQVGRGDGAGAHNDLISVDGGKFTLVFDQYTYRPVAVKQNPMH